MADTKVTPPNNTKAGGDPLRLKPYTVIPLPKVVFFYPLIASCFVAIAIQSYDPDLASLAGTIFICTFFVNLMVISFDFPGVKALTLIFFVGLLIVGAILLDKSYHFLGPIGQVVNDVLARAKASSTLYSMIAATLIFMILLGVIANYMWDRWTVETSRLMHKHGLVGDIKEYPVVDLRMEKSIDDVFEYLLLGSGTLVFQPNPSTPPIRLENVAFINNAERRIQKIIRKMS